MWHIVKGFIVKYENWNSIVLNGSSIYISAENHLKQCHCVWKIQVLYREHLMYSKIKLLLHLKPCIHLNRSTRKVLKQETFETMCLKICSDDVWKIQVLFREHLMYIKIKLLSHLKPCIHMNQNTRKVLKQETFETMCLKMCSDGNFCNCKIQH